MYQTSSVQRNSTDLLILAELHDATSSASKFVVASGQISNHPVRLDLTQQHLDSTSIKRATNFMPMFTHLLSPLDTSHRPLRPHTADPMRERATWPRSNLRSRDQHLHLHVVSPASLRDIAVPSTNCIHVRSASSTVNRPAVHRQQCGGVPVRRIL